MIVLKRLAERMASIALERANAKHPPFADAQHAWVVILEEIDECFKEINAVKRNHDTAWSVLKTDRDASVYISKIRKHAINLIAEASQVAAMCEKYEGRERK